MKFIRQMTVLELGLLVAVAAVLLAAAVTWVL